MNPYARFTELEDAVREAVRAAREAVDQIEDPAERLAAATRLVTTLKLAYGDVTDARALLAFDTWAADESLTQEQVGTWMDVNKSRAGQVIHTGRILARRRDSSRGA